MDILKLIYLILNFFSNILLLRELIYSLKNAIALQKNSSIFNPALKPLNV